MTTVLLCSLGGRSADGSGQGSSGHSGATTRRDDATRDFNIIWGDNTKMDEISGKKNKTWEVFMEEDPTKACAKLPAADVLGDIGEENNQDVDADMIIEGQDPSDDPVVMGDETSL